MNDKKIINCSIKSVHNTLFKTLQSDRPSVTVYSCSNSNNCDLYKRGECSLVASFSYQRCPYGEINFDEGPAKRSPKSLTWTKAQESKYNQYRNKLKSHSHYMAIIGEYIFLPYPFIANCENVPFLSKGGAFLKENVFMKLSDFTVDTIYKIMTNKPEAMMGGEITDYQKKSVPLFFTHLKEKMPEMHHEFLTKYPEFQNQNIITNIGRKALLKTVNPNAGQFKDIHSRFWTYDGTYLISKDREAVSFPIDSECSECIVKIKPSENCVVIINSEEQVKVDTIFVS